MRMDNGILTSWCQLCSERREVRSHDSPFASRLQQIRRIRSWGQISTLNISEKCLDPVEHLLQLLVSLGFACHPPACLRYCRVTDPKTLSYVLERCSAVLLTAIEADIAQQRCAIPKLLLH